ncbi:unnamed protein product [Adineta ricciae]|uniref:Uncharacterized protein n=1 Tax=Adineta ricciae TaxID=249248 RepID=A0A815DY27_ADIRI|nr:unnamed protein product [Adineta ricciae]CAF1459120.1 unnamed protein product [Adineta ricciae]
MSQQKNTVTSTVYGKCIGCHANAKLNVCSICHNLKCIYCIGMHQQIDTLLQIKAKWEAKDQLSKQQTSLKCKEIEESTEKTTTSSELLTTTYHTYGQQLEQSQANNQQHVDDLKEMLNEPEKISTTNVEDCTRIDEAIDRVEKSSKKELCTEPNTTSSTLGSLNDGTYSASMLDQADIPAQHINMDHHHHLSAESLLESNATDTIETENDSVDNLESNVVVVAMDQKQQLSKSQKRRLNQKKRKASNANKLSTVPEASTDTSTTQLNTYIKPVTNTTATLYFSNLTKSSTRSLRVFRGQKTASNNEYLLVCPKDELWLLDTQGNQCLAIPRRFDVYDMCWSTYLNKFLVLSSKGLYSFDHTGQNPLTMEVSAFANTMDECTCHENIFMVISDAVAGADLQVWNMEGKWKMTRRYSRPKTCRLGEAINSIRFSSSGTYLGVTLTAPFIGKAFFQLRNPKDLTVLEIVERPFYEGYCNHYMLALPNDEFLGYKYSEREIFVYHANGHQKDVVRYSKSICSISFMMNGNICRLAIQTHQPDELHFHDL